MKKGGHRVKKAETEMKKGRTGVKEGGTKLKKGRNRNEEMEEQK